MNQEEKKTVRRFVVVLEIVCIFLAIYFFFSNEDWHWYTENPSLLFVVGGFAVLFGLAAFIYYRLNKIAQFWSRVGFFAAFAVAFTILSIVFCTIAISVGRAVLDSMLFLSVFLGMILIALLFWRQCWIELKTTNGNYD